MRSILLDELCDEVGYTATRTLLCWFGGKQLYVPKAADVSHPLNALLGFDAFARLVSAYAAMRLMVPTDRQDELYRRDKRIAERLAAGATVAAIASEFELTARSVSTIRLALIDRGWIDYAAGSIRRGRPWGGEPKPRSKIWERAELSTDSPHPSDPVAVLMAWPSSGAAEDCSDAEA